jgi:hypothetical protein
MLGKHLSVVDELSDSLYVFFNDTVLTAVPVLNQGSGLRLIASPNPAPASGTVLRLSGTSGGVTVDVLDVRGRRLRRLGTAAFPGEAEIAWDGRDARGVPLPAGAYVVVARGPAGNASTVVRLVR